MNGLGLCCCGCLGIKPAVNMANVIDYALWPRSVYITLYATGKFRACSFVPAAPNNDRTIPLLCDYSSEDADYYYYTRSTNHGRTLFAQVRISKAREAASPYYHKDIRVEIRDSAVTGVVVANDGVIVQTVDPNEPWTALNENWETAVPSGYRGIGCVSHATVSLVSSIRRWWESDLPATRSAMWAPGGAVSLPFLNGTVYDGFYLSTNWGVSSGGVTYGLAVSSEIFATADAGNYVTVTGAAVADRDKEAEITDLSLFTAVSSPPSLTGITC